MKLLNKTKILGFGRNLWGYLRPWPVGLRIFFKRGGPTLAASVSFYTLLSIIPFALICLRLVGKWVKDISTFKYHLFNLGKSLFPQVAPDLLNFVEKLVSQHLWAGKKWTYINLTLLAFSVMSIFNAIWNGVHWLTNQENKNSTVQWFKGMALIILTLALMVSTLMIPPLMKWGLNFATSNFFVEFVAKNFPPLADLHTWAKGIKIGRYFFFKSGALASIVFLFYFTFLYRWFYPLKVKTREAFLAAVTYVVLLLGGRELFWVYLKFGKKGLVANYGANYTIVIGIMWIFFLASLFFYGICLIEALHEKIALAETIPKDPTPTPSPEIPIIAETLATTPHQGNEL